jgi:2-keto-4-pentenoate hydratase/2-oxohepta-3-ene-1,7-dioic acid hydratase in catechol pathway
VVGDGVVDLGQALGGRFADLKALLEAGALGQAQAALQNRGPNFALADMTLLPVIPNPGKIWCCGLNYGEHVRETQREVTEKPTFFLRVADSQVGHGQAIPCPPESSMLDYEGEIAVVIGKAGRRLAEADAWDQVVLVSGRPKTLEFNVINQISLRADSLATLKATHRRVLQEKSASDITPITHGNLLSLYVRDPESNRLELYLDLPWYVSQLLRVAMDLTADDATIMARAEAHARTLPGFKPRSEWRAEMARKMGLA